MNKSLSTSKEKIVRSLRFLAWIHAIFFISGSVFLALYGKGEYEQLLFVFFVCGLLSAIGGIFAGKNFLYSGMSGILAAIFYWTFSILEGLKFGFIKGITLSVTLLGILSIYYIVSNLRK